VLGVQALTRVRYPQAASSTGLLAGLLALIPGLGAVYNRQNLKAAVHFLSIVGSFQLTRLRVLPGLFALGGFVFYLYSIFDAYRTARSIAAGESVSANEAKFKRSLVKAAPFAGLAFVLVGVFAVVQFIHPFQFSTLARLLPAALILAGGYLLVRYFKRSRDDASEANDDPLSSYSFPVKQHRGDRTESSIRLVGRGR
jgi:hypothetical protein